MYNQIWNFLKDHISYNDISALASIATFVSALIALFTLRSMNKQNKNAHKPELFLAPSKKNTNILLITKFNSHTPSGEFDFAYLKIENKEEIFSLGILYTIENVGAGTAKHINIKWNFDIPKAIAQIQKTLKRPFVLEHIIDNNFYELKSTLKPDETLHNLLLGYLDYEFKFDFTLPRKDELFDRSIIIPYEITNLYALYFMANKNILNRELIGLYIHEDFKEFPIVSLIITYKDIAEIEYTKEYKLDISMNINNIAGLINLDTIEDLKINYNIDFKQVKNNNISYIKSKLILLFTKIKNINKH
ncbi:MAG: hypothetical protein ACK48V_09680 [Crocinitomicaceae bacterium]